MITDKIKHGTDEIRQYFNGMYELTSKSCFFRSPSCGAVPCFQKYMKEK